MKPKAQQPTTPEAKPGAKPDPTDDLKTLPIAEVEKKLGSSADGLTQAEATKQLTQYGANEIEEKKTNALLKFLSYFWGPIPWMIEVAVVLSGVVRHWPDFFIILVLLLANAVVGFWEERQAGNAVEALKARLAVKARVKREAIGRPVLRYSFVTYCWSNQNVPGFRLLRNSETSKFFHLRRDLDRQPADIKTADGGGRADPAAHI